MNRVPVQSSTIKSIGHDPKAMILEIEFTNGSVYRYFDVPPAIHDRLMQAESLGQFFVSQVKRRFRYVKL